MSTPPPTPDDRRRLDAYLARVRALSAADWGRLDAIGMRLTDTTPWARLRLARLDADMLAPFERIVARPILVGGMALLRATSDVRSWLVDAPRRDPLAPLHRPVLSRDGARAVDRSPESRAWEAWIDCVFASVTEIRRAAREAPALAGTPDGGAAAARVLELGFMALWSGIAPLSESRHASARLYAPVEPVIPRRSLDGSQPRLPGGG